MSLVITTRPPTEPLTRDEAKDHLNISLENTRHDRLITKYIKAATVYCEGYLQRALIRTEYAYSFNSFPSNKIYLPVTPAISVESITYFDANSSPNIQTVATSVYGLDLGCEPSFIYLKYNQTWPNSRGGHNDVTVNFTAGYMDSGSSPRDYSDQIPETIKSAMKMIVGDLFLTRETVTDMQTYKNDIADRFLDQSRNYE